jgi:hypothetical protein
MRSRFFACATMLALAAVALTSGTPALAGGSGSGGIAKGYPYIGRDGDQYSHPPRYAYGPDYGYVYGPDYSSAYAYLPAPTYGAAVLRGTAWCAQRYRSFDPATGTYLGYDGREHLCS